MAARRSDFIHTKDRDEITSPFPNFNSATVEVSEWISYFVLHFTVHMINHGGI